MSQSSPFSPMVRAALFAISGVLATTASAGPSALSSRPGEYEISVTSESFGMKVPGPVQRQCVTQKEMDQGHALASEDIRRRCPDLSVTRRGSKVAMSAHCTSPALTISGEGTSDPDAFSMRMALQITEPVKITHVQTVNARRVGDCKS